VPIVVKKAPTIYVTNARLQLIAMLYVKRYIKRNTKKNAKNMSDLQMRNTTKNLEFCGAR